jgi:hypothetical protein
VSKWVFSDGTEVETGAVVRGESGLALRLRQSLAAGAPRVEVVAAPAGTVPLDSRSDWLLHRWLTNQARIADLIVQTDYVDDIAKAPAGARELIAERAGSRPEPNAIY